ncbi:MAG TPA: hypothetical protein VE687_16780 [Stellaceae bacterium]|nr:hypothetical protein [Stellaceae bacterium]
MRRATLLAARPKLSLLDEPAGGLNHEEVVELRSLIRRIRDDRTVSVLLVEYHMGLVMSVSDKVVALDFGRQIAEGAPAMVQQDEAVIRAYLGRSRERRDRTKPDGEHGGVDTRGNPGSRTRFRV